jgi:predicted outer membrane repeat protein
MRLVMRTDTVVLWCWHLVATTSLDGSLCSELLPGANPSWKNLVRLLDNAPGDLALLCGPFHLTNCGTVLHEYKVQSQRQLDIVCMNGDCVIDCPLVQFRVAPNATLTLESLTIQNTIRSSIVVEAYGTLVSRSSRFRNNQGAGDGGAIFARENSTVFVSRGRFTGNIATRGGAIYTEGNIVVRGTSFWNNQAVNLGGAIYYGGHRGANASITGAVFGRNSAAEGGPAVFSNSDVAPQRTTVMGNNNKGCSNHIDTRPNVTCNGIEWRRATCFLFARGDSVCDRPATSGESQAAPHTGSIRNKTAAPLSRLPAAAPSLSVPRSITSSKSVNPPVTAPVMPTAQPTISPIVVVEPTKGPTGSPTVPPTAEPTASAADTPVSMPTATRPTVFPIDDSTDDEPTKSSTNSPGPTTAQPTTEPTTTTSEQPDQ